MQRFRPFSSASIAVAIAIKWSLVLLLAFFLLRVAAFITSRIGKTINVDFLKEKTNIIITIIDNHHHPSSSGFAQPFPQSTSESGQHWAEQAAEKRQLVGILLLVEKPRKGPLRRSKYKKHLRQRNKESTSCAETNKENDCGNKTTTPTMQHRTLYAL